MRTFLIQCKLPDASTRAFMDLVSIIQKVNIEMNLPGNNCSVTWRQSFLSNERLYCIYSSHQPLSFVKENVPIANLITTIEEISGGATNERDHKPDASHARTKKLFEKNLFKF
jgi:hypothetical protein